MRKSQHSAISRPPPRQWPLIAAMTTLGVLSNLPIASFAHSTKAFCTSRSLFAKTETSAPAEKNFSEALRTTMALTALSLFADSIAASSSSRNTRSYELAGGRSSTMWPIASCFSSRTAIRMTSPACARLRYRVRSDALALTFAWANGVSSSYAGVEQRGGSVHGQDAHQRRARGCSERADHPGPQPREWRGRRRHPARLEGRRRRRRGRRREGLPHLGRHAAQ